MEANGIFVEVVDVHLVVLVVAAGQVAHTVIEGVLLLIHVGSLAGAASTRVFVDVGVLVDYVLGHELVLVGLLDALLTLELVLVAVLAVGNHGTCLTGMCQHVHDHVLDMLYL